MKKILFIGSIGIKHNLRLACKLLEMSKGELEIHFFDPCYKEDASFNEFGFEFHTLHLKPFTKRLISMRKIGVMVRILIEIIELVRLLKKEHFSLVGILFIPIEAPLLVKISHRFDAKTMLVPMGSDVLRIGLIAQKIKKIAFRITDYVAADCNYRFYRDLIKNYGIPTSKCIPLGFGSDPITLIRKLKGKYSKEIMEDHLGLKAGSFNIVCGYNATLGQRHEIMLQSLLQNIEFLPKNYLVIVPLTYGLNKEEIINRIRAIDGIEKLNIKLMTEYMSVEEVAYLRLVTDLFIHVQTTDAYNASLQEFLLAGAQCINGTWLEYDSLEKDGVPYLKLTAIDELPQMINDFFTSKLPRIVVPKGCVAEIRKGKDWGVILPLWIEFLSQA